MTDTASMPGERRQPARALVTGAGGQLGTDVVLAAKDLGVDVVSADREALDITSRNMVLTFIDEVRPDVVVNCAAFTAVDACETNADLAYAVNAEAVGHLAEACAEHDAHLVHISTDYVFDGTLERPYREGDTPNPMSVYGRSKLAGEQVAGAAATIVRTSWVCGEYGSNMVRLVRRLARERQELAFVDDQRGRPSFTADLAPALWLLAAERRPGIVHLTNTGTVSWYEFVREVMSASGHDPDRVRPITTDELDPARPAPRPRNSVLDNVEWRRRGHASLRDFREPLAELVARLDRQGE